MLRLCVAALCAALIATAAHAHGWYPPNCCSDNDCRPVNCEDLEETKDGGQRYGDTEFRKDRTYPSQDAKCHVCISPQGVGYCAFIQFGG